MDATLFEIAEAPAAHVVPPHPEVVRRDGYCFLALGPGVGAVQRIRLTEPQLEQERAEVRSLAAERRVERVGWWVTELTTPRDVGPRLGLELDETLAALALTHEPSAPGGCTVREVTTLEDYTAAQDIDATVNGWPLSTPERLAEMWAGTRFLIWLALEDDRPVGMARCAIAGRALTMIGGAVLPEARGRGVYRSLVAARWRTAVERGVPALVTTANDQSAPILRRVGFEDLGAVEIWVDRL
jgi:GNAT superfamily N-acetyltransferase